MRQPYNARPTLDCIPIPEVELNLQCRDEIVPILKALQHLYQHDDARQAILELVGKDVNASSSPKFGRPGLDYWEIVVLAAVRLGCNLDYDKLQDLAENHRKLRQIMGIGTWDEETVFDWRQLRDNITLLRPETIKKLNDLIVAVGHAQAPKALDKVRVDAFVVETNIHYPTESSLLRDGFRKIIPIAFSLAALLGLGGWRQQGHLLGRIQAMTLAIAKAARSKRKDKTARLQAVYRPLIELAEKLIRRARDLERIAAGTSADPKVLGLHKELKQYLDLTEKVLGTAKRRIVQGETVPNCEKVFSIFEPHTELINRGKTPNPIQFGHNVLVVEDAAGFICDYQVVPTGQTERAIVVDAMKELQARHDGKIKEASFDRGFHSPENQEKLADIFKTACLPPTGKKGATTPSIKFRAARQRHPGVESAIGALQSGNGLERCRDRTETGYQRYVGLGVLGRNLQVLGKLLLAKESPGCLAAFTKRQGA